MNVDRQENVDPDAREADVAELLAAEVTEAAYFVALQHGVVDDSWIEMKLDLWDALTSTIRKWRRERSVEI